MSAFGGSARRAAVLLAAMAALLVGVAACGGDDESAAGGSSTGDAASGEKLRVAWLWYGPKDDGGYNVSQWRAAQAAIKEKYGDKVEQIDLEKVPYSARGSQMAEQVMREGADLVIDAVAAGELFTSVCARNTDVKCIEVGPVGDYPNPTAAMSKNVSGVFHEFWNQEYVAGIVAGRMTKSNTVGFVGSYKNPAVVGSANAFALGCQRVNPDCKLRLIITNDYFNPPAAVQASNTLVNAGADILHGWTDDPGFCEVAERRGIRVIGQFLDYRDVCPKAFITSTLWNYGPFYEKEVEALVGDEWTGNRTTFLKLGEGADLADWGKDVPEEVQKEAADEIAKIQGGESPFKGPIYDAKGKLRVKEGEELDAAYLYGKWMWTVKGIVS